MYQCTLIRYRCNKSLWWGFLVKGKDVEGEDWEHGASLCTSCLILLWTQFRSVQSLSRVPLFATPCTTAHQASLSIINSQSLLKVLSIKSVMPSNHLTLCHPFLFPLSNFPSIRVFSSESALCIRWPKYWRFSFSISSSNEYSGLISFRIDWLDLLVIQGTLKSLLQHHSSKASILWRSAFFIVQLSHPYMTTGKTIALTRQIFVGKIKTKVASSLLVCPLATLSHRYPIPCIRVPLHEASIESDCLTGIYLVHIAID